MLTEAGKKAKIQHLLATDNRAVGRALVVLYSRQTSDERASKDTVHKNGRGFNSRDAEFLSSLAEKFSQYGYLTPRQLVYARKAVMKYWRQLIEVADVKTPGWADGFQRGVAPRFTEIVTPANPQGNLL